MALKIWILSFSMILLFSACGGSGDGSGSKTTINVNSNSTSSSTLDLKKYESRPDMPSSSLKNDTNKPSYSQPQQQNESQRPPIVQNSYQNNNSANSVSEKLYKYYGDNLVSYTYTYAKGGIFVEVRDGDEIELHLLDSHTLVDEKILLTYGYPMREIVGLKGGLVRLVYSNGKEIIFDYFDNRVVNNSSQEDSDTNYTTSDNISKVKSDVKQYCQEEGITVYQFDYVKYLSNSKYIVKLEQTGTMDMYVGLFIVDISNKNRIHVIKLLVVNMEIGANIDIVSIDQDDGILEYQTWMDYYEHIYIKYNYIDEYEISRREVGDDEDGSSSDNSSSNSSSVQEKLSSQLENLITYKYSYQGGGIFAIGTKNGEYSFYRFDASSLELERSFYNIGLNRSYSIDSIDALPNGNFNIYTSGGVYTFNYFDGSFY